MLCKFCNKKIEQTGNRTLLYCDQRCARYQVSYNWLSKKKKGGK